MAIKRTKVALDELSVVIQCGDQTLRFPPDVAIEVARAMLAQARQAEEFMRANDLILDNAVLLRAGVPIGLSDNPDIVRETIKEAQHNSELRRFMPGGIKSTAVVGTPTVINRGPA